MDAMEPQRSAAPAVRVREVGKCYQIYPRPADRLKQMLFSRFGRHYGHDFWALRDVSFEVRPGESFGIIGRNGSGKSTLLQIIAGILAPTRGEVETHGRVGALLELGSGFNPDFTGRENVFMNAAILGLSPAEIAARFDDIAAFADLGEFIDQPVKTYSSGMFVRLAFAVIAHIQADILIVDEALAVGDVFFVQKCMRFLRAFQERGILLFVTHDTAAVVSLCQRAIWLDHGQVRAMGAARDVTERYLEAFYADKQGPPAVVPAAAAPAVAAAAPERPAPRAPIPAAGPLHDPRLEFINRSPLRNDIQLIPFTPETSRRFGDGGAEILEVALRDAQGRALAWIVGGETVTLSVRARAVTPIPEPIIGFLVNDRLGQAVFGDNTFLTTLDQPHGVAAGAVFGADFTFQMPRLPAGDFAVTVAVANGSQADHIQHQWIHDALTFKSVSTSVCGGLVGIPMLRIEFVAAASGPSS